MEFPQISNVPNIVMVCIVTGSKSLTYTEIMDLKISISAELKLTCNEALPNIPFSLFQFYLKTENILEKTIKNDGTLDKIDEIYAYQTRSTRKIQEILAIFPHFPDLKFLGGYGAHASTRNSLFIRRSC